MSDNAQRIISNFEPMKKQRKNRQRRTRTQRHYTYGEFLVLFPCCSISHQKELLATLDKAEKPGFLAGVEVPASLGMISYGKLYDLRNAAESKDLAAECIKILLGLNDRQIYTLNVFDVFGFMNFVKEQISNINNLFASLKVNYSSEELAAGVKDLEFGSFGVLDWYARRMGITNQNEVRDVAWVRIYNCMKNDTEQNNYERRLRKQYQSNITKR